MTWGEQKCGSTYLNLGSADWSMDLCSMDDSCFAIAMTMESGFVLNILSIDQIDDLALLSNGMGRNPEWSFFSP